MANIEVSIKIDIKPTEAERSPDKRAEQTDRGYFRLVLDEAALSWTSMRWKTACSGRATRRCGMPWRSLWNGQ